MNKVIVTRAGFGECLREGLECTILSQKGEDVVIILLNGDVWHGKMNDLMVLDTERDECEFLIVHEGLKFCDTYADGLCPCSDF